MAARNKPLVLRRPAQVAALASPVRTRIVDVLAGEGSASVRELAAALGRPAEALYYHIRVLERHGLLVQHGKRQHKRRHETVYGLPAPRLLLDRSQRSPRYLDAVAKSCATLLRATARDYNAALHAVGDDSPPSPDTLSVRRLVANLDRAGQRQLNDLLRQIDALFRRYQDRPGDQAQSLTIALVPLPQRKSQRPDTPNRRRTRRLRAPEAV
ncbi:MAG: helix-turn-helix domain-containing protein [Phycisphaerae bacterium]